MASTSESIPGYVLLRFPDGTADVHASWARHFREIGRLEHFLWPSLDLRTPECAHRLAYCRPTPFHVDGLEYNGIPPVCITHKVYAFPKAAKSVLDCFHEFNRIQRYHARSLPVPFPIGYLDIQKQDARLLTEYLGPDTLISVLGPRTLFSRIYATTDWFIAHTDYVGKDVHLELLKKRSYDLQRSLADVKRPDTTPVSSIVHGPRRYVPQKYRGLHDAIVDAQRARDRAYRHRFDLEQRLAKRLSLAPGERRDVIANVAHALRKFSDAGVYLRDVAARQIMILPSLEARMVDFESTREQDAPLSRAQRARQFDLFLRNNRFEAGRLTREDKRVLEGEYVA